MKTIRTQQIVKAFILLKRRRVSTADRVYIAFKLKSITLDKQFERMMKNGSKNQVITGRENADQRKRRRGSV